MTEVLIDSPVFDEPDDIPFTEEESEEEEDPYWDIM